MNPLRHPYLDGQAWQSECVLDGLTGGGSGEISTACLLHLSHNEHPIPL